MSSLLIFAALTILSYGQIEEQTLFTTAPCGAYPDYQKFTADNSSAAPSTIFKVTAYPSSCLDDDFGAIGTAPWIWECDTTNPDQWFNLVSSTTSNNVILEAVVTGNTCLQLSSSNSYASITMQKCDTGNILQEWNIKSDGTLIPGSNTSLCLTVTPTLPSSTEFTTAPCGKYPEFQQFTAVQPTNSYTVFKVTAFQNNCFDDNYGKVGTAPWILNCDPNQINQFFDVIPAGNGNNVILEALSTNSTCPQIQSSTMFSPIVMETCDKNNIFQQWNVRAEGYISTGNNASLCLTVGMDQVFPNCTVAPLSSYPFCNQQLPTHERVKDLVSRMSLNEKVQNLGSTNPGVPRLGVPKNLFHEALHGVLCGCGAKYQNNTGCPTSFPHATLLGATFNRSLWREIAESISTEARSFANQGITGLFYWAPDINLFRDPRWGRGQEVPGEDPFLTGQYVEQYSYFMQNGPDAKYLKVISTAKHYADYDQEGNYGTDRGSFDANVTMQDQVEYYWPAWRSAVQTAHVQSIMCSYNAVNNMPSCGNDYFMNEIVRAEWGFDGFFVSDCGAIGDGAFTRYIKQTYPDENEANQQYQQARVGIQGGCDTNCGSFYQDHLQGSVENNITPEQDVDRAVGRLFTKMFDLGKLDFNPRPYYTTYGAEVIDTPRHRHIAQNAAEQGIVLLKNENILPLSKTNTNGKSIAMIGPHADATQDMLSNYHGSNTLVNSNSPYDAMKARGLYTVNYVQGCDYQCKSTKGFQAAIDAAKNADFAIVFLGLHPDGGCEAACEGEGWDRNTIEFPGDQLSLLQQVYAAQKNTILVLINGGAIDISWPKANIPAIIEAFYPGELGGPALANILLGDCSPAAKLPYTIYDKSFLSSRPSIMDMSLRNNGGITYRYYTGTPVYPFGFGLSYTTFEYKYFNSSTVNVDTKLLAHFYRNGYYNYRSEATSFVIQVTNTGKMASDCVVLGFVTSENDPDAPLIKLFDFQRTFVGVGQSRNVTLSITPESISITNKEGNERIVPGRYNIYIGDYQNNNYIHAHFIMNGKEESIFNLQEIKNKYYGKQHS